MLPPKPLDPYGNLDADSDSLHVLPGNIKAWLRAVVFFSFLSCASVATLLSLLTYRLIRWQMKSKRTNQFVILIFNLLLADLQQSTAFLLNVEWLRRNAIEVRSTVCFAQGWFVSTGDLSSGVFCTAIGIHTLASVVFNYRLKQVYFYAAIIALWVFIYGVSLIGVILHPYDLFVRSGVWCWINHDFQQIRLWTHYVFIFIFEFGNIFIYALIYYVLLTRIRSGYYSDTEAKRVRSISNLMVVYPIVYVVCTLPLASARMASMGGSTPSYSRLSLAGVMITSNGWLDVLLYFVTRRILLFSDEPPADDNGFETFTPFWALPPGRFGGTCKIEAEGPVPKHRPVISLARLPSRGRTDSTENLYGLQMDKGITMVTTTQVVSEMAAPEDYEEMEELQRQRNPTAMLSSATLGRWSEDSKDVELAR